MTHFLETFHIKRTDFYKFTKFLKVRLLKTCFVTKSLLATKNEKKSKTKLITNFRILSLNGIEVYKKKLTRDL